MIDTALAYLYTLPPLAAALIATVGLLLHLYVFVVAPIRLLESALDNERVHHWCVLRVRFVAAWWRARVLNRAVIYSRSVRRKPIV